MRSACTLPRFLVTATVLLSMMHEAQGFQLLPAFFDMARITEVPLLAWSWLSGSVHNQSSSLAEEARVPRWQWSPPSGPLPGSPKGHYMDQENGVSIWYAELGSEHKDKNTPVLLLHGGQGNVSYFASGSGERQ